MIQANLVNVNMKLCQVGMYRFLYFNMQENPMSTEGEFTVKHPWGTPMSRKIQKEELFVTPDS